MVAVHGKGVGNPSWQIAILVDHFRETVMDVLRLVKLIVPTQLFIKQLVVHQEMNKECLNVSKLNQTDCRMAI